MTGYLVSILPTAGDRLAGRDDRGAATTEYALLAGFIALAIIAAVTVFGAQVAALFQSAVTAFGG